MFNELFWYLIASFKSFVHWKCRENNLGFKKIFLDFCTSKYYPIYELQKRRYEMATKKLGRPTSNPKPFSITLRLDSECMDILQAYCKKHNSLRVEAIRTGIKKLKDDK